MLALRSLTLVSAVAIVSVASMLPFPDREYVLIWRETNARAALPLDLLCGKIPRGNQSLQIVFIGSKTITLRAWLYTTR
jgi:hypothetical protein